MGKFVFRMEKLLSVKEQLEKIKQNELGNALKVVEDEKNILKAFESEKINHIENIRKHMIEGVSVQDLKRYNEYLSFFEEKIKNQKKIVNDVKMVADNIREELIKVSKEKKMLEILRQKKYEEYLKEEQKKEELEVSEVVSYKYIEHKVGEENGNRTRSKKRTNN